MSHGTTTREVLQQVSRIKKLNRCRMNRTNFEHAGYALLMQLPFGLAGYWWVGAALASGFFLGREHAQIQHALGYTLKSTFKAFDIRKWSLDAKLDLLFPVVAVLIVAGVMG